MLFHGSLFPGRQSSPSAAVQSDLANTRTANQRLQSKSDDLLRQVEFLALANQALFELISDKLGITEGDVIQRMQAIDARDGKTDGKMGAVTSTCPNCGRIVNTGKTNCIYCGALIDTGHLFQKGK